MAISSSPNAPPDLRFAQGGGERIWSLWTGRQLATGLNEEQMLIVQHVPKFHGVKTPFAVWNCWDNFGITSVFEVGQNRGDVTMLTQQPELKKALAVFHAKRRDLACGMLEAKVPISQQTPAELLDNVNPRKHEGFERGVRLFSSFCSTKNMMFLILIVIIFPLFECLWIPVSSFPECIVKDSRVQFGVRRKLCLRRVFVLLRCCHRWKFSTGSAGLLLWWWFWLSKYDRIHQTTMLLLSICQTPCNFKEYLFYHLFHKGVIEIMSLSDSFRTSQNHVFLIQLA